ncbi:MAG: NAD(P)H-hydrate epimerase, partial [Anaerolineaceae bacterium]|nr:NAD(P)H-hydrate epimerase [Anaerolineaceae bacterium]
MKLVTVAEVRQIEAEADAHGWTYAQMMERAGLELAKVVHGYERWPESPAIAGLVGTGNNGGDTLVALAALASWGWKVTAYLAQPRKDDDLLVQRLLAAGGRVIQSSQDADFALLDHALGVANIVLDGVLGTGCKLPLRAEAARVLGRAKQTPGLRVVAVDCPSGVDCDSGAAAEECLSAELTVCMAVAKIGLAKLPAFTLTGQIRVVEIGLPEGLEAWDAVRRELVDEERVRGLLPRRPLDGHKGTFGTLVVAGGCMNYPGAP